MNENNEYSAQKFYEQGLRLVRGTAEELIHAEACFTDAADSGHAEALHELAKMHLGLSRRAVMNGEGSFVVGTEADSDPSEGLDLLRRAAEAGCGAAQRELEKFHTQRSVDHRVGLDGVVYSLDGTVVLRGPRGVREIRLEPNALRIAHDAFAGCLELERINLPSGIVKIGARAFNSCVRLAEVVLPKGIEQIGARVFVNCASLKSVSLPDGIQNVPAGIFEGCVNLKAIRLPQSVERIDSRSFAGCALLEELELPRTVERIEGDAFLGCLILNSVRVFPDGPQFAGQLEAVSFHDVVVDENGGREETVTRVPPTEVARAIVRRTRGFVERPLDDAD